MKGNSHPNLKIIKPCNFMRAPRLRASPRHGGTWSSQEYSLLIRRGGVPSGAAALILYWQETRQFLQVSPFLS